MMTPRSRFGRWAGLVVVLAIALPTGNGRADSALYLVRGSRSAPAKERWLSALQESLQLELHSVADVAVTDPNERDVEVDRASLAVLSEVERALLETRELNAQFREAAALRVLWEAEQKLLAALTLPGVHAYLAEVSLQLGLCAAQLGELGLAETAFKRAASLDGTRRIEAAEAPPATLALARAIARAQDTTGNAELTVHVQPRDASLWLDGVRLSSDSVRARTGEHLLVVRAPGYTSYAALLHFAPGLRPVMTIALSELPVAAARRALLADNSRGEPVEPAAQRLAALTQQPVLLLEPSAVGNGRVLVERCLEAGCALLFALDEQGQIQRFAAGSEARAWLGRTTAPSALGQPSKWKRWPVWTASAVLVVAGVTSALLLRGRPEERRERSLAVTPDPLPP